MTAELRALNARFIHNFITNDVPGHDAILHKDFICISPAGARVSRADYLEEWATGFDPRPASSTSTIATRRSTCSATPPCCASTNKSVRDRRTASKSAGMTIYTDTLRARGRRPGSASRRRSRRCSPPSYPPDETIVKKYVKGVAEAVEARPPAC